jgi:Flp pilus assembly pilin Flp
MVFACGGLLWLTVGTVLDRLRGPMSILNAPARQMSVILGLTGLGFFIALALSPLRLDEAWRDVSTQRFVLGVTCGLALVGLFGWAAASFRRTLWVYFAELSLAVLLLFLGLRLPSVYENPQFQEFWPVLPALLALVMLAVAKLLEGQRIVLFGHPLFFTAVFFLPLAPLVETVRRLMRGEYLAAIITLVLLAAVAFFGSSYRLVARWRSGGRAK